MRPGSLVLKDGRGVRLRSWEGEEGQADLAALVADEAGIPFVVRRAGPWLVGDFDAFLELFTTQWTEADGHRPISVVEVSIEDNGISFVQHAPQFWVEIARAARIGQYVRRAKGTVRVGAQTLYDMCPKEHGFVRVSSAAALLEAAGGDATDAHADALRAWAPRKTSLPTHMLLLPAPAALREWVPAAKARIPSAALMRQELGLAPARLATTFAPGGEFMVLFDDRERTYEAGELSSYQYMLLRARRHGLMLFGVQVGGTGDKKSRANRKFVAMTAAAADAVVHDNLDVFEDRRGARRFFSAVIDRERRQYEALNRSMFEFFRPELPISPYMDFEYEAEDGDELMQLRDEKTALARDFLLHYLHELFPAAKITRDDVLVLSCDRPGKVSRHLSVPRWKFATYYLLSLVMHELHRNMLACYGAPDECKMSACRAFKKHLGPALFRKERRGGVVFAIDFSVYSLAAQSMRPGENYKLADAYSPKAPRYPLRVSGMNTFEQPHILRNQTAFLWSLLHHPMGGYDEARVLDLAARPDVPFFGATVAADLFGQLASRAAAKRPRAPTTQGRSHPVPAALAALLADSEPLARWTMDGAQIVRRHSANDPYPYFILTPGHAKGGTFCCFENAPHRNARVSLMFTRSAAGWTIRQYCFKCSSQTDSLSTNRTIVVVALAHEWDHVLDPMCL